MLEFAESAVGHELGDVVALGIGRRVVVPLREAQALGRAHVQVLEVLVVSGGIEALAAQQRQLPVVERGCELSPCGATP